MKDELVIYLWSNADSYVLLPTTVLYFLWMELRIFSLWTYNDTTVENITQRLEMTQFLKTHFYLVNFIVE